MLKCITFLIAFHRFFTFSNSKIIHTTTGDISGTTIKVLGKDVDEYLGIPYAKPPLGDLRFKPPVPVEHWKGVFNATKNPIPCMQIKYLEISNTQFSEDCLFINVWVPRDTTDVAMVYFHGGGFMFGSINKNTVDGSVMSSVGGVIFVSVSYRLGPFGFMYSGNNDAQGNMGMKDQVLGLRWIKDNIEAFGGNSSKITIFGHSAGAISVSTHLVSPLTKGLFKSALMQSGSSYNHLFPVRPRELIKLRSELLANIVGCANENQDISTDPNVMSCMRNISANSILLGEAELGYDIVLSGVNPFLISYTPIYGDDYLPNSPIHEIDAGNIHVKSFMIGTTKDEGSMFLMMLIDPLLEQFDYPEINKWRAVSYIKTMYDYPKFAKQVVDYYLSNMSTPSNDSLLLKRVYDSIGDYAFSCPSVFLSERASANGKNVYYYVYNYNKKDIKGYKKWMGVAHRQELPFVFGIPLINDTAFTPEEKEFSKELIGAWTSFAKEDKPSYKKLLGEWPLYKNNSRVAIGLNPFNANKINPFKDACSFWRKYI